MVFTSLALLCRFIVFGPTFNSRAAALLAQMMPVCWCTSLPLCFRLTPPPIALSPMSLLVGRPHFRHFTMFNLGVVHPSTLQNLVHLPTRSPCLRLSLRMTLQYLLRSLSRILSLLLLISHKWILPFSQSRRQSFLPRPQHLLPLQWPLLSLLFFFLPCPQKRSDAYFTIQTLLSQMFARATRPTPPTIRLIGLQKKFTASWVVENFAITSIFWTLAVAVNGSMAASFPCLLDRSLLFQRRNGVRRLIGPPTVF